jgi:uncharacterized membrane protein
MTVKALERLPQSTGKAPRHAARLPARSGLGAYVGLLALMALAVPLDKSWAAQVLLIPLLLIVPGVVLLRVLRIPGRVVASFPLYVPSASLVVLLFSGLAVDLIGPRIGVSSPLRPAPMLVGLDITCCALLAASVNAPPNVAISWSALWRPGRWAWPLILPLASAAGALRLNAGHGNTIALIALSACVVVLVTTVILSSRLDATLLAVILYAAGLAMMWSFSLRGDLVYGFDIAREYSDLQQAVQAGFWHTFHPGDAYGAMLSVTILPAELHFLSGVPDLLVFKVVYPAISALFPLAVFYLGRSILSRRWAFAAAAFIAMQGAFEQELPGLARQEISLIFFAALIATMVHTRIQKRFQWALVALFGLSMALSHYSTTYVAIAFIGIVLTLQWALSWFREIPRVTGAVAIAFISALAGAAIWYGPVTHSDPGLQQLAQAVGTRGLDVLPNQGAGEGVLALVVNYLRDNGQATSMSAHQYQQAVHAYYQSSVPYVVPLKEAKLYPLHRSSPETPPVKFQAYYQALGRGSLLVQQLADVLGVVGALMMVLRRRNSIIARQIGLLALAAELLLEIIKLSGTFAAAYNQERADLQGATALAITLCWSMQALAGRRMRRQSVVLAVAAVSLTVAYLNSSGLVSPVLGGGTETNLANKGEDFERFDMMTPELASASWLGKQVKSAGGLVYADRYAQLPLVAVTGIGNTHGLLLDVTPLTINQYAWVYASQSNVIDGQARAFFDDHSVTYVFPSAFLKAYYDTVYTNGSSEVFWR